MRKRNLFTAASLMLCLSLLSFPAQAAFFFNEKPAAPKTPETRLDLTGNDAIVIAQIGPGKTEKKESQGNNVLLPLAIELISPDKWAPIVGEDLKDQKVSWQSGPDGDWVKTLEDLGKKEGLRFVINWKSREIAVGAKKVEALTAETDKAEKKNGGVTHLEAEAVENPEKDSAEDAVSVSREPWNLEPGSLKDQLAKWADRAGYSLIWDNQYDYRLDAGQTFYGQFTKAVNEVVTALYRNGARIRADIYTKNQVLYISGGPEK